MSIFEQRCNEVSAILGEVISFIKRMMARRKAGEKAELTLSK